MNTSAIYKKYIETSADIKEALSGQIAALTDQIEKMRQTDVAALTGEYIIAGNGGSVSSLNFKNPSIKTLSDTKERLAILINV